MLHHYTVSAYLCWIVTWSTVRRVTFTSNVLLFWDVGSENVKRISVIVNYEANKFDGHRMNSVKNIFMLFLLSFYHCVALTSMWIMLLVGLEVKFMNVVKFVKYHLPRHVQKATLWMPSCIALVQKACRRYAGSHNEILSHIFTRMLWPFHHMKEYVYRYVFKKCRLWDCERKLL